ncbi:MAG TPA: hypothetical protein VKB52_07165, partial [Rhodanobacteraceae bacterium]|nr:hypothetical protein [Rhodanobacteraceae bacterium]
MSFRRLLLAALVALLGPTAHGAELWAGSSCTLTTIQAAVDAAAASGESANTIHLLADETYSERVHVDGLNLTLRGASAGCGSVFYVQGATSTIDGTGGSDASLLAITGSGTVVLRDLTFQNGHAFVGGGGGITVAGSGSVSLDNVGVILNSASDGGGIIASGQGGSLDVYINEDTLIANNTAQGSGGGIQIGGSATLHITDPDTWIALNHAPNGYGGGIDVLAPARALIGSPGFHGTPAVYSNNAAYGGGIAVRGTGSDSADLGAKVVLFTSDPANPVQVSSNTASVSGGGVYLVPLLDLSVGSAATLDAYDFIIDDNLAPEGSALALDTWTALGFADDGSKVDLNTGARPAGAVACAANVACSE